MTAPDPYAGPTTVASSSSSLVRAAIWVAIGALIAAAIVCVIWVLVGTQNGIVGRAFLTILLLAAFAGVAIMDAHLAARRPAWFAMASMVTWVVTLLIGAVMIWLPDRSAWGSINRFAQFLLIVLILQLALLHIRLYMKAFQRYVTPFTQTVAVITIALVVGLAVMLVLPLMLGEWVDFRDLYWRFVVAVTILAAVGTALIPLINALFAPQRARPALGRPSGSRAGSAALADVRRRRHAAAAHARRVAGLERLLHRVSVVRLSGHRAGRSDGAACRRRLRVAARLRPRAATRATRRPRRFRLARSARGCGARRRPGLSRAGSRARPSRRCGRRVR